MQCYRYLVASPDYFRLRNAALGHLPVKFLVDELANNLVLDKKRPVVRLRRKPRALPAPGYSRPETYWRYLLTHSLIRL